MHLSKYGVIHSPGYNVGGYGSGQLRCAFTVNIPNGGVSNIT